MIRSSVFRPSVTILEDRLLPSASIYTIPLLNSEQASYVVQAAQADNPVVFFGDSITYNWGTATRTAPGTAVFSKYFAPLGAANFGIYGDNTTDLVERVQGGDFAGKPKVAVLMIGVNNLIQGQTPLQAATGVAQVILTIEAASPRTSILLLGVLPSDEPALNPKIQKLDSFISVLGNHPGVVYENPGVLLLGANGEAQPDLLMDVLHPDQAGYTLIAGAIDGTVVKLLQEADYQANQPQPTSSGSTVHAASVESPATVVTASEPASESALIPLVSTTGGSSDTMTSTAQSKAKDYATELIDVPAS